MSNEPTPRATDDGHAMDAEEMRAVAERRRDAEDKLAQHQKEAEEKAEHSADDPE